MPGNWKKPKIESPIGKVNRSQVVSTFGIGSLYELRTFSGGAQVNSVIIGGLDYWPEHKLESISEPVLAKSLGVEEFRSPPIESEDGSQLTIPAFRFPEWMECSSCHRLGRIPGEFTEETKRAPRCAASGCNGYGIPVRLVTACYDSDENTTGDSPGHIDDFPWKFWAHSQPNGSYSPCDHPELFIENTGKKAGLDGLVIKCRFCGKSRSLAGVFSGKALSKASCYGYQPWLGDRNHHTEDCKRPVRALLRGASNVFFPVTASAISIPPYSNRLIQEIEKKKDYLKNARDGITSIENTAVQLQNVIPGFHNYDISSVEEALRRIIDNDSDGRDPVTESDQRLNEREAIVNDEGLQATNKEDDFHSEKQVISDESGIGDLIGAICKVHRLREVRAFRGFHRIDSTQPGGSYKSKCAPISGKKKNWLPAIEVRGEGIYLELKSDSLKIWENQNPVVQRLNILREHYSDYCSRKGIPPDFNMVSPRYVLIHTLSHLMIKQLSLDCGYSSASIRERLYTGDSPKGPLSGVLLYTASACTDGTLGGLVRQGDDMRLAGILRDAVNNARWCSSDPLCIESKGQGVDALNLAACHACSLVSETSCEQRNLFLDRALIVGTYESPEIGYFHSFLD